MLGFSVWLILFGAIPELDTIAKYFPQMMTKIWPLEIGLVDSSRAIRNRTRQNCRPGEGAWTPREEDNQTPLRRNPIGEKQESAKGNRTEKNDEETREERQDTREKRLLKKDSENLKRQAWG